MKRGLVFGKFMPLHKGHQLLIETGISNCDELTVVVCSLPTEPIDGNLRYEWTKKLYGDKAKVFHLNKANLPQVPEECASEEEFYGIWRDEMLQFVEGGKVDILFTSEDYGDITAKYFECEHMEVNKARDIVPVSGTACRTNPYANWQYMHPMVRTYFTKSVLVIGGESTGKSTLTKNLEEYYLNNGIRAYGIQEYARHWIDTRLDGDMDKLQFKHITLFGTTQMSRVRYYQQNGVNQLVISDTDAIVSSVFQQLYFGKIDQALIDEADLEKFDLALLLYPDVPWVNDGQRNLGEWAMRMNVFEMLRFELSKRNIPYVIVKGEWGARFKTATRAINDLIGIKVDDI